MKNKKIIMYISIIILIVFILSVGFIIVNNNKGNNDFEEYTPEEEISETQLRKTNILLYFKLKESEELATEIRQIDSKELLENPEKKLIQNLIEGPQNNELEKLIPDETEIIDTNLDKGILTINFSEEFIKDENLGEEHEKLIINSILKTVAQLKEINSIKIIINGEENKGFADNNVNFDETFEIYKDENI